MSRFYLTTAIDFVNSRPHLGTAYEKIAADVIARAASAVHAGEVGTYDGGRRRGDGAQMRCDGGGFGFGRKAPSHGGRGWGWGREGQEQSAEPVPARTQVFHRQRQR